MDRERRHELLDVTTEAVKASKPSKDKPVQVISATWSGDRYRLQNIILAKKMMWVANPWNETGRAEAFGTPIAIVTDEGAERFKMVTEDYQPQLDEIDEQMAVLTKLKKEVKELRRESYEALIEELHTPDYRRQAGGGLAGTLKAEGELRQ